jgi:hypothetical protein
MYSKDHNNTTRNRNVGVLCEGHEGPTLDASYTNDIIILFLHALYVDRIKFYRHLKNYNVSLCLMLVQHLDFHITQIIIIIIIIIIIVIISCQKPFLPGTFLEPTVIPTTQASSFTLQYFSYYV